MDKLQGIIKILDTIIWDYFLMYGLLAIGLFFTVYLGFPQFRRFGAAFKQTFGGLFSKEKKEDDGGVSSFSALAVAIAAQVGTGNIAGVATAIMAGGPGAVFWMWISAIFGMGTIFAEAVLAQKYRGYNDRGELVGGPAYYISRGLGQTGFAKFLAGFFAVAIVFALGLVGNMVQSNSISQAVYNATGGTIPLWVFGIIIAILAALVFIGGLERISNFATLVVPFMAVVYLIFGFIIIVKFRGELGGVFGDIFKGAFTPQAIYGGALGLTIRKVVQLGVARGLFSNEAGMGSTPHAHAVANVKHPGEQGLVAIVGVFVDTIIVCTFTALIILLTGANFEGLDGAAVTQKGFEIAFGHTGVVLLAIALSFFAFTTIIGWYYFAESNIYYLFGQKGILPFQILVIIFIIIGSAQKVDVVWSLADVANGLMVIPNIIGLALLSKEVKGMLDDFDRVTKDGLITYDYVNYRD